MSVQTSYGYAQAAALAGLLADIRENTVESYAAEGNVGFGLAVVAGTVDDSLFGNAGYPGPSSHSQVKVPTAAAGKFRGVSVFTHAVPGMPDDGTPVGYVDKMAVNVLRRGLIWVPVIAAVANDAPAFFVNTGADAGKFDDSDGGGTADEVPTGIFRSETAGPGLALLEINLP